jgi:hypothetical protein
MMLSGSSGGRGCCTACSLGDASGPAVAESPSQGSRLSLLASLAVAALAAGAVYAVVMKKPPLRLEPYRRRRTHRTVELPEESMEDVVWERRR